MTRAFDNNSFMHGLDIYTAYSTVNKGRSSWVVGFYTRGESHVSKFRAAQYVK